MRRRGLRGRMCRKIDEWEFRTEWVRDAKEGDRHYAVYEIKLQRSFSKPFDPDHTERDQVAFIGILDKKRSSARLQKADGLPIEARTYEELYAKCAEAFDTFTARDWRKVIIIGIDAPENYTVDGTAAALSFNYSVVERAGPMYRRCSGYLTRNRDQIVEGDKIVEMEWNPELEKALEVIRLNIDNLTEKLREIIEQPALLLQIKPNLQLK